MSLDEITADFEVLDDWEDRYRYVMELGRALPALDPALKIDVNKVRGCASQVWIVSTIVPSTSGLPPRLEFVGESDAHIVRGLVAILLAAYGGKTAPEILAFDAEAALAGLGLNDHLSPQRSNGLASMIKRIKADAAAALEN